MLTRRKFKAIEIRHVKPEHSGSDALKYFKFERLIAGNPINIKHEYNTRKPKHTKLYEEDMVIREGKMGSLGTADFRELAPGEVSNYLSAFRENAKTDEIKNRLAGIRRIIMFSGV